MLVMLCVAVNQFSEKEASMRMLVEFQCPLEPFNSLVRKGTADQVMQQILGDLKPEAAYFTAREGKRGGILVVDLPDPSKIPAIAEPFFLHLQASVTFFPCMTPEDLTKANLTELGRKYA
jgi:hypothetical protein